MAPDGNGGYAGGIYNADDGQTYRSKIVLRSAAQLEVQGCAGPLCGRKWRVNRCALCAARGDER